MRRPVCTVLAALLLALSLAGTAQARPQSYAGIIQAAERGNPTAQTQLGFMYENGVGVNQDYYLAAKWYHRAAEQGETRAQHRLGLLFNKGFGVGVDLVESYKWLNLAAARARTGDRGHYMRMRDAVASKMTYYEINEGQLRATAWRPKRGY